MNIKRNKSGIGKRAVAAVIALVTVVGICAFAPSPVGNSALSLKSVHTDGKAVYAYRQTPDCAWFREMVEPNS